jgi:hypothetical protein
MWTDSYQVEQGHNGHWRKIRVLVPSEELIEDLLGRTQREEYHAACFLTQVPPVWCCMAFSPNTTFGRRSSQIPHTWSSIEGFDASEKV